MNWFCGSAFAKGRQDILSIPIPLNKGKEKKRTRANNASKRAWWLGVKVYGCRTCSWPTWDLWFSQNNLEVIYFLFISVSAHLHALPPTMTYLVIQVWFVPYPGAKLTVWCSVCTVNSLHVALLEVPTSHTRQWWHTSPAKTCGWNSYRKDVWLMLRISFQMRKVWKTDYTDKWVEIASWTSSRNGGIS